MIRISLIYPDDTLTKVYREDIQVNNCNNLYYLPGMANMKSDADDQ